MISTTIIIIDINKRCLEFFYWYLDTFGIGARESDSGLKKTIWSIIQSKTNKLRNERNTRKMSKEIFYEYCELRTEPLPISLLSVPTAVSFFVYKQINNDRKCFFHFLIYLFSNFSLIDICHFSFKVVSHLRRKKMYYTMDRRLHLIFLLPLVKISNSARQKIDTQTVDEGKQRKKLSIWAYKKSKQNTFHCHTRTETYFFVVFFLLFLLQLLRIYCYFDP